MPILANPLYARRVDAAVDHVVQNPDLPLSLEDVAAVAGFSPFHFHRVFAATTGETLHAFVTRVRLERALHLMAHRRTASLTEVALACGFSSSSHFSRTFRAHYGVPPRRLDIDRFRAENRLHLLDTLPDGQRDRFTGSHDGDAAPGPADDADAADDALAAVRLRPLAARRVAYIRVVAPYAGGVAEAAAGLVGWARARGLDGGQWLGYQWDDPETVPLDRCRYDVGLEVPDDLGPAAASGPDDPVVGFTVFPPTTVAEVDVSGTAADELAALDLLYRTWLPASGWAPAHQPCFEAWRGLPFGDGTEHFELTVQLPVVPLTDVVQPLGWEPADAGQGGPLSRGSRRRPR
ncbi:GyrI-like domain-containing protein [Kineosporia sp. A_224]|uniref:AraC family transcriptional regulator n=1 Tax=Kineosporia sp. A_224 TaxID=1962180 RepID=UPI000B4C02ED|nr:helix-turn-helix domain-containing protein [Kineosporia sp. A_224]